MMGPPLGFLSGFESVAFEMCFELILVVNSLLLKRIESPGWKHNMFVFPWTFSENSKGDHRPGTQRFKRCSLYVPTRVCEGYKISQTYMDVLAWRIIPMITFTQIQQL